MKLRQNRLTILFSFLLLTILVLITVGPLLLMLVNSLKTRLEISTNPLAWPKQMQFSNYRDAWLQGDVPNAALHSISLVVGTLLLTIITSCMAAYSLSQNRLKHQKTISTYLLVCNTLPKQLFIIPLFIILQRLGLINNIFSMLLVYCAIYSPFSIFLLKTYFEGIDKDIVNSAIIDGASSGQVFWLIVMPLVQPGILTVALILGLWVWNEFLFSVTFLQDDRVVTLAVKFYSFMGRYQNDWGTMMAYAVIVCLPIVIFFIFLQNKFIDGMTAGGIKG